MLRSSLRIRKSRIVCDKTSQEIHLDFHILKKILCLDLIIFLLYSILHQTCLACLLNLLTDFWIIHRNGTCAVGWGFASQEIENPALEENRNLRSWLRIHKSRVVCDKTSQEIHLDFHISKKILCLDLVFYCIHVVVSLMCMIL